MTIDTTMVCQELVHAILTFVAGACIAYVGLVVYFRQKEYELVKQRYLEQCCDLICTDLEAALGAHSHNWARCLQLVKEFRDLGSEMDIEQLDIGFVELTTRFNTAAHYRLRKLVESSLIFETCQLPLAFCNGSYSMAVKEIPSAIRSKVTSDEPPQSASAIIDQAMTELKKLDSESHEYSGVVVALQELAFELEQQRLDFKSVRSFGRRAVVVQILAELSARFKERLASIPSLDDVTSDGSND